MDDIKQKIIELCGYMIGFWDGLSKEIEQIPNEDKAEIVYRWYRYFEESCSSVKFSETKRIIDEAKEDLIMSGELLIN
jgi:hypothetical protein